MIPPEAGEVFYNNGSDQTGLHIFKQFLNLRAIKIHAAETVVYVEKSVSQKMFLRVLFKHDFLIDDAVAVALQFVILGQPRV